MCIYAQTYLHICLCVSIYSHRYICVYKHICVCIYISIYKRRISKSAALEPETLDNIHVVKQLWKSSGCFTMQKSLKCRMAKLIRAFKSWLSYTVLAIDLLSKRLSEPFRAFWHSASQIV